MSRQKPGVNPAIIIVIVVSILLIIGLIKNAIGLYQSRNRLESKKVTVSKLESTKQTMQKNIDLQSEPGSLDQTIRNKLNLSLPGETIVVISGTDSSPATSSPAPTPEPNPETTLYQWWRYLNPS